MELVKIGCGNLRHPVKDQMPCNATFSNCDIRLLSKALNQFCLIFSWEFFTNYCYVRSCHKKKKTLAFSWDILNGN